MVNTSIDHIAIVVKNIEKALNVYQKALGLPLDCVEKVEEEQVKIAFLPFSDGDSKIELLEPITDDSGVARFLDKHGEGIHHVCLAVDAIEATMATLAKSGLKPLYDPPRINRHNQKYTFIHPKTTHGVLLELYEKLHDTEQEKSRKAQIGHSDRLALMGQVAAGIAHDLNNLISSIDGYTQLILLQQDTLDDNIIDTVERIRTIANQATRMVSQMVNFSADTGSCELFNINIVVSNIVHILDMKFRHHSIELIEDYAQNIKEIYGNSIEISQVILNIVINACESMQNGGKLKIQTVPVQIGNEDFVQILISDTGHGIGQEIMPHIFEPFFTTKQAMSGTGLGLAVTKQIVDEYKGKIHVYSTTDKGTLFTVLFPVNTKDM